MGLELSLESQIESLRSRFDSLDISGAPRQYPDIEEPVDSSSSYGRYRSALYYLGESFEEYSAELAFTRWNDSFTSSREFGERNIRIGTPIRGISIKLENREIVAEVKWDNHKLVVRKDGLILNDGESWVEFDDENFFPLIVDQSLISKVSKEGVELVNLDYKDGETVIVTHDSLIEALKLIRFGLDQASDLLQKYRSRKKESRIRIFVKALEGVFKRLDNTI